MSQEMQVIKNSIDLLDVNIKEILEILEILPSLASKSDLEGLATQESLDGLCETMATKEDIANLLAKMEASEVNMIQRIVDVIIAVKALADVTVRR